MADVFELQSCCNEFQFTDPEDNFESWNGLRGPAGPAGPPGPAGSPGTSVELRGPVASTGQLPATAPSGELWLVGTASPYEGWFYNGTSWQNVGQIAVGPVGPAGPAGDPGSDGTTFMPSVSSEGMLSWTNDGGKPNPDPVNIRGPKGEPGDASLTILSYGNSTWADFIAAYNAKSIVYCRASITAADPGAGAQVRMAVMAYVNHPIVPTSVDFVYYFPATHSDSQQGDQLFVYTLSQTNGWSYVVKNTFSKIVAGENMSSSYANGTLTLNATGGGGTSDYDDLTDKPSINNVTLSGNKTAAELGLGTYSKPSGGIPQTDLESAVQSKLDNTVVVSDTQPTATENKLWVDTDAGAGSSYQVPTVAEMDAADVQTAAEIGVVITGKRPSMAVTEGQYVIVRGSTISGITDGLYTANTALSPSTDVTAANLMAVSNGGLNSLQQSKMDKVALTAGSTWNFFSCYGYTDDGQTITLTIPVTTQVAVTTPIVLTRCLGSLRSSSGQIVGGFSFNYLPYVTASELYSSGRGINIKLNKSDGFGITGMSIVCGYISLTFQDDL